MTATAPAPAVTAVAALRARGRVRGGLPLLGPAFVAAIAYVDPGNVATNSAGGASYGYLLVWVVVAANVMAVLVQGLAAKLGLATGANLAELSRRHYRRPVAVGLWLQAELVAMATDLAEVIGGAVALQLLFGLPLVLGGAVTAAVAFALLGLQRGGHRPFEVAVTGLFAVIVCGFLVDLLRVPVDPAGVAAGLVPRFEGPDSVLLATGILGATVMPHALYLHSALTQDRVPAVGRDERRHLLRHQRVDLAVAMGLAALANLAILLVAAGLFQDDALVDATTLEGVHAGLAVTLGSGAATVFAVALLASGFASAGVGTLSGQVVMQGFLQRRVPVTVRRAVTLLPALGLLVAGVDPTRALVLSQVVLSFGLPFALVPLVLLTRRADLMGELVNRRVTTAAAAATTAVIVALNVFLVLRLLA